MKIFRATPAYLCRNVLALLLAILSVHAVAAKDFATLQDEIQTSSDNLDKLEDAVGRYDYHLLEPLEQLARIQIEAHRFSDADRTLDRAIQIARFSEGLYSSLQYPLLQLSIVNSQSRRDWDTTEERLDRFSLLVANQFDGDSDDQLSLLKWMSDKHLQCALDTSNENQVNHIIKSTLINEYAVQLAQRNGNTDAALHTELLHSLSHKYYIETRGILGGGESGHSLRALQDRSGRVETKVGALNRRYAAGLEKLLKLRDIAARSEENRLEAIAMAEIYIADWNLIFNAVTDIDQEYGKAMNKLLESGISETRVQRFFSAPVVLPRTEFTLNFDVASSELLAMDTNPADSLLRFDYDTATNDEARQLNLVEGSEQLPGFVLGANNGMAEAARVDSDDWSSLMLTFDIEPGVKTRNWYHGYSIKSPVTPSNIELRDAANVSEDSLKAALSRFSKTVFRPAFSHGSAVTATFSVQYRFRDEYTEAESGGIAYAQLDSLIGD